MTFTLTRAQFEKCRADLAANGVTITGDSGRAQDDGVEIQFSYEEPTLTVAVLHKPMILTEHYVEGKITGWFTAEQAA